MAVNYDVCMYVGRAEKYHNEWVIVPYAEYKHDRLPIAR